MQTFQATACWRISTTIAEIIVAAAIDAAADTAFAAVRLPLLAL